MFFLYPELCPWSWHAWDGAKSNEDGSGPLYNEDNEDHDERMRTSGNGGNEEKTIISFMGSGTGHDARACGMPGENRI